MTIIYQYKVATASFFGFFKLLKRWRGSVYKLIFKETVIFLGLYATISLVYRFALNTHQRRTFEHVSAYCNHYTDLIPVSFVLGFYVSVIVHRWWTQFTNVPWPDRTLYIMGSYLVGRDDGSRIIRRTVARYMLSSLVLILRSVSISVMKRYPTMEHIVDAGFMTPEEVVIFEKVNCTYNKFWVPLVWANSILTHARRDGKIDSDIGFRLLLEQIADFRDKCSICFVYDWITIPLVYTQVVTLSVYMFIAACLIGRQYVDNDEGTPDLYFPFFTLLQFFFYMGWLKVAEQLINPFGEDDDDYDMNWLIDRHTSVAMNLVDFCHDIIPPLVKDAHFNELAMEDLPYTEASMGSRRPNFMGSTYNLARPSRMESRIVPNSAGSGLLDVPNAGLRHRSNTGPRFGQTGSVWSLFGYKQNLHKAGSRDAMSMANGVSGLGPLNSPSYIDPVQSEHRDSKGSEASFVSHPESYISDHLPPEYVPLRRARASTETPQHKPLRRVVDSEKERKWSFPLNLLRKKQEKDITDKDSIVSGIGHSYDSNISGTEDSAPLLTPQMQHKSRFHVEPVPGDHDVDASKQTRNKQIIDKHLAHMAISRPPMLSAIEEGNTIRSVKEIVSPSHSSHSLDIVDELIHYPDGELPLPSTIEEEDIPHDGDYVFQSQENVFEMDDDSDTNSDMFGVENELQIKYGRIRSVSECDEQNYLHTGHDHGMGFQTHKGDTDGIDEPSLAFDNLVGGNESEDEHSLGFGTNKNINQELDDEHLNGIGQHRSVGDGPNNNSGEKHTQMDKYSDRENDEHQSVKESQGNEAVGHRSACDVPDSDIDRHRSVNESEANAPPKQNIVIPTILIEKV